MAKKKEEGLKYMQMPLPQGQKTTRTVKLNWSGLNYRQTMDTGALSYEKNLSTNEAPYLTPSGTFEEVLDFGEIPHYEEDQDGSKIPVGKRKCVQIYGYQDTLAAVSYLACEEYLNSTGFKDKIYDGSLSLSVYDSDMNNISICSNETLHQIYALISDITSDKITLDICKQKRCKNVHRCKTSRYRH